jgi:type I restriction enzyme R subunit
MNEAETRAERVDPALRAAGWGVVEGTKVLREYAITAGRLEGHGRRAKAELADYVLVYRNKKLAVIEAKSAQCATTEGAQQAKRYAAKLCLRFCFATNGRGIYRMDLAPPAGTVPEGEVGAYPTPDELWSQVFAQQNEWRERFGAVPFEDKGGLWQPRYYQDLAIERVLEAIAAGRQRVLLTLATGTGKTSIAFQIAWKLFQSRWNLRRDGQRRPRILFLADRNILANQAFNAFSAFAEDALVRISPDEIRKKQGVPKNGSVFFTIFQTFMSGPGGSPYFGDYPPDFFDLIVVDECHRGGANDESTWRGILEYFAPAVQLGLTATPRRRDNVDTYAYFGDPVYTYSLREGINDGFLTPFRVKEVSTTLDDYVYTPDDVVLEGTVEPGRRYAEGEFNRVIEIREREQFRVRTMLELIGRDEKTIVFCANQEHALAVRDLINQQRRVADASYCVRVTADDGKSGEDLLKLFQDNERTIPTILTTSHKLSTGVDATNVRNIVLLRPVTSMIEFKQIIGRGTRLHDGKDYFTVVDFVQAHRLFQDPEWDGEPVQPEPGRVGVRGRADDETRDGDAVRYDGGVGDGDANARPPRPERIKVRLADGKERQIRSMVATSFWSPDGRPMSAQQFLESLFGAIPSYFRDEDELRRLWSVPSTRRELLARLAERGFGSDQLAAMQKLVDAEHSDIFDVLAYVAFTTAPRTREERAERAVARIRGVYSDSREAFLKFVLEQYVRLGVDELDDSKLSSLLRLRYRDALQDAIADLGQVGEIRELFLGFQHTLYSPFDAA